MTSAATSSKARPRKPGHRFGTSSATAIAGLILAICLTPGCGKKGDPLPPLRYVPATTADLTIHQQGNQLIFRMGYPQTTASGQVLSSVDAVDILEMVATIPNPDKPPTIDPRMFEGGAKNLVRLQGSELLASIAGNRIEARLPIAAVPESAELRIFGVRTMSGTGEISDTSNLAPLILRPITAAPKSLTTQATAGGVQLDWEPANEAIGYNLYRKLSTERTFGEPQETLGAETTSFVDTKAVFGQRYIYTLRAVASADPLVEGAPSLEREVDFRDRFPPVPPTGLIALGETGQARVVWEASSSPDTASYAVYRRDGNQTEFRRITDQPITALEYLDEGLSPGVTFTYRVSAIDGVGNEGTASEPTSALVE